MKYGTAKVRGQGALEYLLLIGGAVIVSAVVIVLLLNTSGAGSSTPKKTIGNLEEQKQLATYGYSIPGGVSNSGLVGYWKFEGDAKDVSKNGKDGTVIGGVTYPATGMRGQAAQFNGTSGYIQVPSLGLTGQAETVSMWIKYNSNYYILLYQGDWGRRIYSNYIHLKDPSNPAVYPSIAGINDGQWHNIAYTISGTTAKSYVDGALKDTKTLGANISPSSNVWWFGQTCLGSCGLYYNGLLDEIIIFNRALSDDEIKTLYSGI